MAQEWYNIHSNFEYRTTHPLLLARARC